MKEVTLGDVIRRRREALDLTQTQLANAAKCSQQTIGKIESNNSRKPQNLPNIAKALGVSTEEILAEVTEPTTGPTKHLHRRAAQSGRKNRARWPFENIRFELYDQLDEPEQLALEVAVFAKINEFLMARLGRPQHGGLSRDVDMRPRRVLTGKKR